MPNFAMNHQDSRKAVCCLCIRKSKETITPAVLRRIRSFITLDLDFDDPKVPLGICATCRLALARKEKDVGNDEVSLPTLFDFSKVFVPRFLRSSPFSCNCLICRVARSGSLKTKSSHHPAGLKKRMKGRPRSPKVLQKHCPKCLATIGRGKRHFCTPKALARNMAEKFPDAVEKAAVSVIKDKKPSPGGTIRLSQQSGPLYPLVPGTSTSVQNKAAACLSTEAMIGIQSKTNLSNHKMRQLASFLNTANPAVKVEKNFQKNFAEQGKKLERFFVTREEHLMSKGQLIQRTVVFCQDIEEFVWHVLDQRNLSPPDSLIKVSLDGGGKFFKVCLQVMDQAESSLNVKKDDYLFSGVKKIFIIAIIEDIPENFFNISKILGLLNIDKIHHMIVCDLKVANILCGLQGHASKHPCCFCEVPSDKLHEAGPPRTLGSLQQNFEAFKASGKRLAADFKNSVNEPIIQGSDQNQVLDVLAPPELHILLGVVNHLFQGLKKIWNQASLWPEMLHIHPSPFQGGDNFNGPSCHKLLQHIDKLEHQAELSSSFQVGPFVRAFRDFRRVVHSCFGMSLDQDFAQHIQNFRDSCDHLPISITPKLHILFVHVPEFINRKNLPLGVFSEQASETVHQDFQKFWDIRYK